jgi:hypothetical protein
VVGSVVVEPPTPTRRSVLRGGLLAVAVAAVAACDDEGPREPAQPHPDVVLADEAAMRERELMAAYDAAAERAPDLAERLAPLRAQHAEHLAALSLPEPPPADPTATPGATPSSAPVPGPVLPDDPAGLLSALAELERRAATEHAGTAVRAGRGLAVVLASAAASEASHVGALA